MLRTVNTAEAYHCRNRKSRLFHDLERICLCFFRHMSRSETPHLKPFNVLFFTSRISAEEDAESPTPYLTIYLHVQS